MLIYWHSTFSGLIPCKLLSIDSLRHATVRITATRGAWKRGVVEQVQQAHVVARRLPGIRTVRRTMYSTTTWVLMPGADHVWWFPDYMVLDPWEELARDGFVTFARAQADER
jgi:hypothetical protein